MPRLATLVFVLGAGRGRNTNDSEGLGKSKNVVQSYRCLFDTYVLSSKTFFDIIDYVNKTNVANQDYLSLNGQIFIKHFRDLKQSFQQKAGRTPMEGIQHQ